MLRTRDTDVYLHVDEEKLQDFVGNCEDVLKLTFTYKKSINGKADDIDCKCRKLRRERLASSTKID